MQENMNRMMSKFHTESKSKNGSNSKQDSNNDSDSKSLNKKLFSRGNRPEPLQLLAFKQHFKGGGSNRKISFNAPDEDLE